MVCLRARPSYGAPTLPPHMSPPSRSCEQSADVHALLWCPPLLPYLPTPGPLPGALLRRAGRPPRAAEQRLPLALRPGGPHRPLQRPAGDPGAAGGRKGRAGGREKGTAAGRRAGKWDSRKVTAADGQEKGTATGGQAKGTAAGGREKGTGSMQAGGRKKGTATSGPGWASLPSS